MNVIVAKSGNALIGARIPNSMAASNLQQYSCKNLQLFFLKMKTVVMKIIEKEKIGLIRLVWNNTLCAIYFIMKV